MTKRLLAQLYLSVLFLSSGVISFAPHALPRSSLILRSSLKDDDVQNPIAAFLNNFKLQRQPSVSMETEEERLTRLKREELMELEEKEVERALKVKEDAIPYLLLLALQFLPLVGSDRIESIAYFWGVAVATVYVGGRQVTLQESETVSSESALYAPIGASVSIGVLYALIKAGFNPAAIYAFGVTVFGALAISDIGVPLLRNVLPSSFAQGKVKVPNRVSRFVGLGDEDLPLDGLTTLILGIGCTAAYWSPIAMDQKFLLSNCECLLVSIYTVYTYFEAMKMMLLTYDVYTLIRPHSLAYSSYCMGSCNDFTWRDFPRILPDSRYSSGWSFLL